MEDFCGIYVHGYDRPFSLIDNLHAILPFRELSAAAYPLYIFFAVPGDIAAADRLLGNVIPVKIPVMNSVRDYDEFMIHRCFQFVKQEHTLTMHLDGHLLKGGWEDYAVKFDYVGASWHEHIPDFDYHYKNNAYAKFAGYEKLSTTTTVGNGGFCFRRRSKMLEVYNSVDWETQDGVWLPDDVFYSFYGFSQGIFRPVSVAEAEAWSEEPYRTGRAFGFHGYGHTADVTPGR